MLNYMKSECYRIMRNKSLGILTVVCGVLMIGLVLALKYFDMFDPAFPYGNTRFALSNLYMQMNLLLMAAMVFSAFMHDNEEKHHTIKHSIAFGIRRSTVFLGRFAVQAIVGILIYIVLAGIYTAVTMAMLNHENVGELESLFRVSLGSATCLLAALGITHFFLMLYENQTAAYMGSITVLLILPSILNLLGRKVEAVRILAGYFPLNVVSINGPLVSVDGNEVMAVLKSLLTGAVWLAAFLVLGVVKYQKKEIK